MSWCIACTFIQASLLAAVGQSDGYEVFRWNLEEIWTLVEAVHTRINSLDVVYLVEVPTKHSSIKMRYHKHHLRVLGSLRMRENVHWNSIAPPELDLNHTIQLYRLDSLSVYFVNKGILDTTTKTMRESDTWKVRCDPILDMIGWWPDGDDLSPTSSRGCRYGSLLETLTSGTYVIVNSQPGTGEEEIVVLRSSDGRDTLWLDPRIGFAVTRREIIEAGHEEVSYEFVAGDFRKFDIVDSRGRFAFWVPFELRETWREGENVRNPTTYHILKFAGNSLVPNDFRIEPELGAMIIDRDKGHTASTPGGIGVLDRNIEIATQVREISKAFHAAKTPPKVGGERNRWYPFLFFLLLFPVLACYLLFGRKKHMSGS